MYVARILLVGYTFYRRLRNPIQTFSPKQTRYILNKVKIMTTVTLQTVNSATMTELKAFANSNDVFIDGDRRRKATWILSITDFLIECGEMDVLANLADIDNGVVEDITLECSLEELKAFQAHNDTILPTSTVEQEVKSNVSPTEQAELEPVDDEVLNTTSTTNQANNSQLSFNQNTTAVLPMKLLLWTLAIVIVPAVVILGWLGNGVIKLVRVTIPLMDTATTLVLEGIVWLTELLFGSDYDEYSDSYMEVKALMRS